MEVHEALAVNVASLMERHGMRTQSELAKLSGVSQAQVSNVLRQRRGASVKLLERLADALEVDPWLLLAPPGFVKKGAMTDVEPLVHCFLSLSEDDQRCIWRITHQLYSATTGRELL
jgi:transcriptional regulator with XRE-family HTH domain